MKKEKVEKIKNWWKKLNLWQKSLILVIMFAVGFVHPILFYAFIAFLFYLIIKNLRGWVIKEERWKKLKLWQKYLIIGVLLSMVFNLLFLPCQKVYYLGYLCWVFVIPFLPLFPLIGVINQNITSKLIRGLLIYILFFTVYPILLILIGFIIGRLKKKRD